MKGVLLGGTDKRGEGGKEKVLEVNIIKYVVSMNISSIMKPTENSKIQGDREDKKT
jgi:hypothetical protein